MLIFFRLCFVPFSGGGGKNHRPVGAGGDGRGRNAEGRNAEGTAKDVESSLRGSESPTGVGEETNQAVLQLRQGEAVHEYSATLMQESWMVLGTTGWLERVLQED